VKFAYVLVLLAACKQGASETEKEVSGLTDSHHDEGGHESMPKQLRVTPEVMRDADLRTEIVKRGALMPMVVLPGEIAVEPDRTARLAPSVAGKLEQVNFNEGSLVKKGDVLAVMRVPDVGRLRGALSAATERSRAATANAARLRALRDSGLGAEQAVVDAEADARAQDAEARALSEQLSAIGATGAQNGFLVPLRAPISGVVVSRDAVVGQPSGADQVLASIVDLSEVWFLGRVFEKDLGRLRTGARAEVALNAFPGERFEGTVDYVGQQTDPVARTLTARIRLKNEEGKLRIGLFGAAHVELPIAAEGATHVIVSRSALTKVGDKTVVFVKAKDGDFVVHDVTPGETALGQVQVLSGLDEGEEVVTHGVFTLKSLLLKSTLAEDE